MEKLTHGIFFRVADFHPENVVQEPVNGFLLIKHKDELHNQSKVWRLKHFSWKDIPSQQLSQRPISEMPAEVTSMH